MKLLDKKNNGMKKDFSIVLSNNVFSLVRGILVSLLVPRLLSIEGYADYKLFTLYASYIGLLHFGFVDGICVKFAGKTVSEIGIDRLNLYSRLIIGLETVCSLVVICFSLFFSSGSTRVVMLLLAFDILVHNMNSYFNSIFQVTMQFKKYATVGSIFNVCEMLGVAVLWVACLKNQGSGLLYICLFMIGEIIELVFSMKLQSNILLEHAGILREYKQELRELFRLGTPLLIAGIVATLILNLDRQFVVVLFCKTDYAIYSFAYSMMSLITTLISSISIVLYPSLKTSSKQNLKKQYSIICKYICIAIFATLSLLYPIGLFIDWFLPNYVRSMSILVCVAPSIVAMCLLQIVIVNYYKTLEKTKSYLYNSVMALVLSFVMNVLFYSLFHSMESIASATVISCIVWFMICNHSVEKFLGIKTQALYSYIFYMLGVYYLVYFVLLNYRNYMSMVVYIVLYAIGTHLYMRKEYSK